MASVYENAFLTLAATSAVNGSEGLFRTRNVDNCEMDIPIVDENEHNIPKIVHLVIQRTREHTSLDPGPLAGPLSTRGWAFQERILSQRIIHFAREELIWECCCKITCECGGQATKESRTWGNTPLDSVGQIRLSFYKTQQKSESCQASWTKVVQKYTLLELTKDEDRLPALSGIASRLITRDNFVAGLQRDNFIHDMMWSTGFDLGRPNTRNSIIQTPSWSWASVNVGVEWDLPDTYASPVTCLSLEKSSSQGSSYRDMITLDIKEIVSSPSSADPYGKVSGGSLHVKGVLIEVLRLDTNSLHIPLNLGYSFQIKQLPAYLEGTPLPFGIASLFPDDRPEINFRNGHLHVNGELPTSFWLLGVQDFWQERHTVAVRMLVLIKRQREGDFRRIGTAFDVFEKRYPLSVREGEKFYLYETLCHRLLREVDPTELQIF